METSEYPRPAGGRRWLLAVAGVLVVGAALLGWRIGGLSAASSVTEAAVPRPPDVRLAALDGSTVALSDYAGETVVVDFWASWCGPCVLQGKILDSLARDLGGEARFLAINLGEDRRTIERYLEEHQVAYPVLMDPEERLGTALEIYVLPTVMVLDREGGISYLRAGISDRPTLLAALAAAGWTGSVRQAG